MEPLKFAVVPDLFDAINRDKDNLIFEVHGDKYIIDNTIKTFGNAIHLKSIEVRSRGFKIVPLSYLFTQIHEGDIKVYDTRKKEKKVIYVSVFTTFNSIPLANKIAVSVNEDADVNIVAKDFSKDIAKETGIDSDKVWYSIYLTV